MHKVLTLAAVSFMLAAFAGCMDDAKMASRNLSKAADNFEINRRVIFLQRHYRHVHADRRGALFC